MSAGATNDSSNVAISRLTNKINDLTSVDSRDQQRIALYSDVIGKCHFLEATVSKLKLGGAHIKALANLRLEVERLIEPCKSQLPEDESREIIPFTPVNTVAAKRQ